MRLRNEQMLIGLGWRTRTEMNVMFLAVSPSSTSGLGTDFPETRFAL